MININAPINSLGYGVAGLNITKALAKLDNVALFPIGAGEVTNKYDAQVISNCIENAKYFNPKAPSLKIWHQWDLAHHVGTPRIGFPFFELNVLNDLEMHHLRNQDMVFVTSKWAKDIVESHIKDKIDSTFVVPLGVDTEIFKPAIIPERPLRRNKNNVIFLNIGKWEIRKGHDLLVDIFNAAFTENDDVELWMMNHNPFLTDVENKEWEDLYCKSKLGKLGKISVYPRVQRPDDVAAVMQNVDVGIFPSRAEGWNLELLEMMACGKPVIATNYSAHTEYCNKANCGLIEIDNLEDAIDGRWFHGTGKWAALEENQIEQTITHMKNIYEITKHRRLTENTSFGPENYHLRVGVETAQKFSWDKTAERILEILK